MNQSNDLCQISSIKLCLCVFPVWERNVQKVIERDRNLDNFPVLKTTFGQERFSRRQEKKEDSTLYKIGTQIAYAFRPVGALFMGWI